MSIITFGIALATYYLLHSILADNGVKQKLYAVIPVRFYRLGYNLLALFLLLPLGFLYFKLEKNRLLDNPWFALPGGLLVIAGLVWLVRAMKNYDLGEFTGLFQLEHARQPEHTRLNTKGLNAQVRHPLYFGTLLVIWGVFLLIPNDATLLAAIISTLYLVVGSWLEERKLVQQFGEAYRLYRREVPMLIPFRWKRQKK